MGGLPCCKYLCFPQLIFLAFSWIPSQAVRGVGVGFEEPNLRLMV